MIRVLRREQRPRHEAAPLLDRVGMLEIPRETQSIDRHVRTIDAPHPATALLIGEPVTMTTHDATMNAVAEHLGLRVIDPVERPGS